MRQIGRAAGWLIGGLGVVALGGSLVTAGLFHRALQKSEGEVVALRAEAVLQTRAEAGRSAQDHARLTQSAADREQAQATVRAQAQLVAEQQDRLHRLGAERDTAVEFAAEQARLLADRQAAIETAADERVRLVQQRDEATAERDATIGEAYRVLRDLDVQTRATMSDVEKIIVAAGLAPGRLVPEPNRIRRVGARGGPYIPWKEQVTLADHLAEPVPLQTMAQQLDRLKSLRDVMVRLPLVAPVTHAILSDGFGYRRDPVNGGGARHEGLDLRAVRDSAVIAPAAGTVIAAGWDGAFGNMIQIDHGFGVVSRYAHLSRMLVRKGDVVAAEDQIGVVGATGRATGIHLHYEIWIDGQPRDPMRFITAVARPFAGFVRQ